MSVRKRIAILVGEAEEEYPKNFLLGFLQKTFSYDMDVCVFSMYRRFQESHARELGESSIFSLVNYNQYDAIVLMLDTIQIPYVADNIEKDVHKHYSGKVLVVDKESDLFPYVEMDYGKTTDQLISHLIDEHGYRDIAYVTGWEGHKHSMQRLNAFKKCMEEHDLPVLEEWIYYGNFWFNGGEEFVTKLVKEGIKMPRAIACANDYMAIGAAKMLTKYGYRVPEDVAVIGYDLIEAGMNSPKPITSVPLPVTQYGGYTAEYIHAMLSGDALPEFDGQGELFIGSSCGCESAIVAPKVYLRQSWDTESSGRTFFAANNHMNEDLLCQTTLYNLIKTVDSYVHQIRDFTSFHICLNEDWIDMDKREREGRSDTVFSSHMLEVLECGEDGGRAGEISFERYFDKNTLIPDLQEEHDRPRVYYFSPLHFEDLCFGYATLCYEGKPGVYDATYRMWLRNVMQALECFRRIEAIQRSNQMLEATRIHDAMTGLYNYNGFLQQKKQIMHRIKEEDAYVGVLAIDIKELTKINEMYGRAEGDRVILMMAHALKDTFKDGISACFGNGEMITILISREDPHDTLWDGYNAILDQFIASKSVLDREYDVELYHGIEVGKPSSSEELERLVNVAVSKKNGDKISERKNAWHDELTQEEQKETRIVEKLLDENLFRYHFQPIVDAKNGEIFGYEALMRPDTNPYMAPPVVLKYAEYFGRLYDVEKMTFFNVLDIVSKNKKAFHNGRKIFINSIPGNLLQGEDAMMMAQYVKELPDTVIVELTEQQELTDEELSRLQGYFTDIGVKTAIDDYGTGYSNVTNLLRYMPEYVKIDRMLLSDIQDSPQKQHFVKDIITFSHDNNIVVLAEGVETAEELQMVIRLGVDLIQGYYTARPAEELMDSISKTVKNEIIEFNNMERHYKGRQVYLSGKESHISLAKLAADNYSILEISQEGDRYGDVTLTGALNVENDMYLRVKNGYKGNITFNNVTLKGKGHGVCVDIGNDCDVTIVLQGENRCMDGGIRVPQDSKLTIKGEGNLYILVNGSNYFGIGNNMNAGHGKLFFEQDGCIEINGTGMIGIGIGSGTGGGIHIQSGKYVIRLVGQEGVGIGSYSGNTNPMIFGCDLTIDVATARAIGVGSIMGDLHLSMEHITWMSDLNAEEAIGIGTFEGYECETSIAHANIMMNLHATKIYGVGSDRGKVSICLNNSALIVTGEGVEAVGWGNQARTAKVKGSSCKLESKIKTSLLSNVGMMDENVSLDMAEYVYIKEGEKVVLR